MEPFPASPGRGPAHFILPPELAHGLETLEAQLNHQREFLIESAKQQKRQFDLQVDMEATQQQLDLQRQYQEQKMKLIQQGIRVHFGKVVLERRVVQVRAAK